MLRTISTRTARPSATDQPSAGTTNVTNVLNVTNVVNVYISAEQAQQANAARETELKSELAKERVAKAALEVKVGKIRQDSSCFSMI